MKDYIITHGGIEIAAILIGVSLAIASVILIARIAIMNERDGASYMMDDDTI